MRLLEVDGISALKCSTPNVLVNGNLAQHSIGIGLSYTFSYNTDFSGHALSGEVLPIFLTVHQEVVTRSSKNRPCHSGSYLPLKNLSLCFSTKRMFQGASGWCHFGSRTEA